MSGVNSLFFSFFKSPKDLQKIRHPPDHSEELPREKEPVKVSNHSYAMRIVRNLPMLRMEAVSHYGLIVGAR
jgi:hypothetical protein